MAKTAHIRTEGFAMSQQAELHQKIVELKNYHKEHKNSYDWMCQKTAELRSYSKSLKKLAVYFAEARINLSESNEKHCKNKDIKSSLLGTISNSAFYEDTKIEALTNLIGDLKKFSGSIKAHSWKGDFQDIKQQSFRLPFDSPKDNDLFINQTLIINTEEEILADLFKTAKLLKKSLKLVDNMDLSPNSVHADLSGPRGIPRLLLVTSVILAEAVATAKSASHLARANEKRWAELNIEIN